jgi:hypothetical protein
MGTVEGIISAKKDIAAHERSELAKQSGLGHLNSLQLYLIKKKQLYRVAFFFKFIF